MAGETIDPDEERASVPLARLPVLEVDDLTVTLGAQCIIEHLSFIVQRGEILTILGPNGAGKTILLRYPAGPLIVLVNALLFLGSLVIARWSPPRG